MLADNGMTSKVQNGVEEKRPLGELRIATERDHQTGTASTMSAAIRRAQRTHSVDRSFAAQRLAVDSNHRDATIGKSSVAEAAVKSQSSEDKARPSIIADYLN